MNRWALWCRPAALAALGNVLHVGSLDPFGWWWLALVAWAPLTVAAGEAAKARLVGDRQAVMRLVLVAVAFSFARWLWLEQWIGPVSEAGWPALALVMAVYDGLYAWAIARSESMTHLMRWPLAIRAAVLLTGCEWLRGCVFMDGYPWFMPAQPLIEWLVLAQGADVIGAAGMGVLPAAIAGALADAWLASRDEIARKRRSMGAWVAGSLCVASVAYGIVRLPQVSQEPDATLSILAVQTNVAQSNKDSPTLAARDAQVQTLLSETQRGLAEAVSQGERIDLVVWPETVVPGFGFERDAILLQKQRGLWPADRYVEPIESLAARGTPILLGSGAYIGLNIDGDRYRWTKQFNSGYLVRGPGDFDRIDKILLTPFGETMPYISHWPWLEQSMLDLGARGMRFDLDVGDSPRLMRVQTPDGEIRIGVPICFEDTVARATRAIAQSDHGAHVLVNLSNDGWFGTFDPARVHHEQAARWRSIELRTPLVRVANTGITSAFHASGRRLVEPIAGQTSGLRRMEIPVVAYPSIYAHVGDVVSWVMFFASIFMMIRMHPPRRLTPTVLAAFVLLGLPACESPTQDKLPSWSSREQSIHPDAPSKLNSGLKPRPQFVVSAAGDPRRNATQLLDEASRATDPMMRAIAIEAMEPDPVILEPAVRRGLGDANPGVRFVATVVGSRAKLPGLAPLFEPLLLDPNESVRAGALLALHRSGRTVDLSPLARMIFSASPEVRGNAAMVIGDIGNRTALPMLNDVLLTPMPRAMSAQIRVVDLQIGEAMVKLGDLAQLEPIHAALFSRSDQGECIGLACQIVGSLRDQTSLPMLQRLIDANGLDTRPMEIRLVAAVAIMDIMRPGPVSLVELGVIGATDPRPEVRAIAAKLLGFFTLPQADGALARLVRDREPAVQIAAAASILRIAVATSQSTN